MKPFQLVLFGRTCDTQTVSYSPRKVGQKSCDMSQNFPVQVLGPVSPAFGAVWEKL
jgi:hypothetical protein